MRRRRRAEAQRTNAAKSTNFGAHFGTLTEEKEKRKRNLYLSFSSVLSLSVCSSAAIVTVNTLFSLCRQLLRSMEVQRDPKRYREVVEKVILYMTLGIDVSRLFSEMVLVSLPHGQNDTRTAQRDDVGLLCPRRRERKMERERESGKAVWFLVGFFPYVSRRNYTE
jgi:hypothetical protein